VASTIGGTNVRSRAGERTTTCNTVAATAWSQRVSLLRSGAVLCVGVDCDRASVVDHMDELGNMIRLGLCCIFRDQPIKFRTTTATANGKMERAAALEKLSDLCMTNADGVT
jgi:hypothetical protein